MNQSTLDPKIAKEAKALVALAFRNGPLEHLHAGKPCPVCKNDESYSRISDVEMKKLMLFAVNRMYRLLWFKDHAPERYATEIDFGGQYTERWNEPEDGF